MPDSLTPAPRTYRWTVVVRPMGRVEQETVEVVEATDPRAAVDMVLALLPFNPDPFTDSFHTQIEVTLYRD